MATEFSFAPDRRSVQGATFHYGNQPSGESGQRGYSQQDSIVFKLDKIYQTKFSTVPQNLRRTLIDILVPSVPLAHRNLDMLAAANYIIYHMRLNNLTPELLTDELYEQYFNSLSSTIMGEVAGKSYQSERVIRAKFKVTLLRYIYYVWNHTVQ